MKPAELILATVKSFNPSTGWGFAIVPGVEGDVFLYRTEFIGEARALTPRPGDRVTIQSIRRSPDGRLRGIGIDVLPAPTSRSFHPTGATWRRAGDPGRPRGGV